MTQRGSRRIVPVCGRLSEKTVQFKTERRRRSAAELLLRQATCLQQMVNFGALLSPELHALDRLVVSPCGGCGIGCRARHKAVAQIGRKRALCSFGGKPRPVRVHAVRVAVAVSARYLFDTLPTLVSTCNAIACRTNLRRKRTRREFGLDPPPHMFLLLLANVIPLVVEQFVAPGRREHNRSIRHGTAHFTKPHVRVDKGATFTNLGLERVHWRPMCLASGCGGAPVGPPKYAIRVCLCVENERGKRLLRRSFSVLEGRPLCLPNLPVVTPHLRILLVAGSRVGVGVLCVRQSASLSGGRPAELHVAVPADPHYIVKEPHKYAHAHPVLLGKGDEAAVVHVVLHTLRLQKHLPYDIKHVFLLLAPTNIRAALARKHPQLHKNIPQLVTCEYAAHITAGPLQGLGEISLNRKVDNAVRVRRCPCNRMRRVPVGHILPNTLFSLVLNVFCLPVQLLGKLRPIGRIQRPSAGHGASLDVEITVLHCQRHVRLCSIALHLLPLLHRSVVQPLVGGLVTRSPQEEFRVRRQLGTVCMLLVQHFLPLFTQPCHQLFSPPCHGDVVLLNINARFCHEIVGRLRRKRALRNVKHLSTGHVLLDETLEPLLPPRFECFKSLCQRLCALNRLRQSPYGRMERQVGDAIIQHFLQSRFANPQLSALGYLANVHGPIVDTAFLYTRTRCCCFRCGC
eukprot:Opistho-2@59322